MMTTLRVGAGSVKVILTRALIGDAADPASPMEGRINHVLNIAVVGFTRDPPH
jgi:hypothetical protein